MLRIIGDAHGDSEEYLDLIEDTPFSLQLGDLDLDYAWMKDVDPERHKFIKGNHDNMDQQVPHDLGDFGVWRVPNLGPIFFVRGAWSIDHKFRESMTIKRVVEHDGRYFRIHKRQDWWPDSEELTQRQADEALELYKEVKPSLVVSHDCPFSVLPLHASPEVAAHFGYDTPCIRTRTGLLFDAMLDHHRPKAWYFGHHHKTWQAEVDGTHFQCVNIAETVDIHTLP
jgi:hypothetical protein